jgi:long-chain acyl-CoA synthetase
MVFVGDSLEEFASRPPSAQALTCADRSWSWSELFSEVECLSREIAARVPKGARVALSLTDPARLLIAFFACARSGTIAMVYDPGWPEERRAGIDAAVSPALLLDGPWFDAFSQSARDAPEPEPGTGMPLERAPGEQDPFYAGFTSGSTGAPKGYCRSHRSWLESFAVSAQEFAIGPGDRIIVPGNMVHSLHLYGAVHGLHAGAKVEVVERFNPRFLAERLRQPGSAVFYATPTQIHYVAEELKRSGVATPVRLVLASGAKWRDEDRSAMAKVFPSARLMEFYGASEMSFVTLSIPEEKVPAGSVGRAAAGVEIRIRSDTGDDLPAGQTGTIWVRSLMLFDGYICGGGTEVARDGDWLTVGDRGLLDEDGFLFLAGRTKRMIVTSGLNIYPEEIEQVLLSHPDVALTAIVARPDPVRGSVMIACVALKPGANANEVSLRRHCLGKLGRSRTPRRFIIRSALPLTPGGKTDLVALERDVLAGELEI